MHGFSFRVRYGDTDQMGWAYYATHLRWFEIGRAEMLRSLGRSYRSLEDENGVRLPMRASREVEGLLDRAPLAPSELLAALAKS